MRGTQSKVWFPGVGNYRVHLFLSGWITVPAGWTKTQPMHELRFYVVCIAGPSIPLPSHGNGQRQAGGVRCWINDGRGRAQNTRHSTRFAGPVERAMVQHIIPR